MKTNKASRPCCSTIWTAESFQSSSVYVLGSAVILMIAVIEDVTTTRFTSDLSAMLCKEQASEARYKDGGDDPLRCAVQDIEGTFHRRPDVRLRVSNLRGSGERRGRMDDSIYALDRLVEGAGLNAPPGEHNHDLNALIM